jgi:hypothetical protein
VIKWQKSSFSGGGDGDDCVQLARAEDETLLRESDDPVRILLLAPGALAAFLRSLGEHE